MAIDPQLNPDVSGRCLVLGGRGFIGSHVVSTLIARGTPVRTLSRRHPLLMAEKQSRSADGLLEEVIGDFTNVNDLAEVVAGCTTCIHSLTTTFPKSSNDDMSYDIRSNLIGSVDLMRMCVEHGVRKVVFISSGGTVYGNPVYLPIDEAHPTVPLSSYAITKLATEKYLHLFQVNYGLRSCVLRLSNPYGQGQRVANNQGAVSIFLSRALRGQAIDIWGDGRIVRDYIFIKDAVEAVVAALDYEGCETLMNVGSGEGHTLLEIVGVIEEAIGTGVEVRFHPARPFDVRSSVLSIERAAAALGWRPRTRLAEGVAITAAWLGKRMREEGFGAER